MNVAQIINELETKYPGKKIIKNHATNPTEIICEIEPTSSNPKQSKAIAVIDQSIPHFHTKSIEEYTVLKGNLLLTVDGKEHNIPEGQSYIIYQMQHHSAKGVGTWVECKSTPGWTSEDQIPVGE